jgi:phospholipid/cholesterol/gamma-HCH transport system substrate-binding protein
MATAVAMTWMVFATLQREVAGPTNTYSAIFTDVSGMAPGDDVRVAGVRVGRVDKIDLAGTLAKVTFRVQRNQVLYTNTIASVTYQNIIGQRYLGLSQGPAGDQTPLPNLGQIPKERTNPSLDLSYVLNGFEPLFTQLDANQVDNLANAIIEALQGDSGSILVLTTQASALAETLAGPDQVLGDLIANLNQLTSSLAAQNTNLQTMIREARGAMAELANRRETLVSSVGSINSTAGRLATVVNNITPDLQEFVGRQPGFLDYGLHDGRQRFAYMAANLPFLIKGLARITQEGSYMNAYACDVDVALWRGLFHWFRAFVAWTTPGNETKHTQMCR